MSFKERCFCLQLDLVLILTVSLVILQKDKVAGPHSDFPVMTTSLLNVIDLSFTECVTGGAEICTH